jgi:hypothetical protein
LKNGLPGPPEILYLLERSATFIRPDVSLLNHVLIANARFVHVVKYDHGHNQVRVRKALPARQEKSQGRCALRVLRDTFGVLINPEPTVPRFLPELAQFKGKSDDRLITALAKAGL